MNSEQGTIRVLDEETINQIAAGEVIERPASVVKELVENSIDADASSITVEITSDPRFIHSIRVVDNGVGMSRTDVLLSFRKHATSKIKGIEDLKNIRTMGFRGEALSSIAAVSRLTIISKQRETGAVAGIKAMAGGAESASVSETGAPEGTTVLVENLFYNTPARKKFLRKLSTELAHVNRAVQSLALANSGISFRLVHNRNEVLSTSRGNLMDTVRSIFGNDFSKSLIPVEARARIAGISGYVSQPSLTRADAGSIYIFINGRHIYSGAISKAIIEGYGTLIPSGRYPAAFLMLDIDPLIVDVNVHPAKRQVRLSHDREIYSAVTGAVSSSLGTHNLLPDADVLRYAKKPAAPLQTYDKSNENTYDIPNDTLLVRESHAALLDSGRRLRATSALPESSPAGKLLPAVESIGMVGGTYIAARTGDELVLIDIHAAHERILYEQVSGRQEKSSQELIVPVTIELSPGEYALLADAMALLSEAGFRIQDFGRNTVAVSAVPYALGRLLEPAVLHDMLSEILACGTPRSERKKDAVAKVIACRGAIKAGAALTGEQINELIRQLYASENPYTCPHGRPTMISFSREKLDKMFGRK